MPGEPTEGVFRALGHRVRSERVHLRISIDDAAARAQMSPVTWGRVEKGLPARTLSYAGIEAVLGWARGSIDRFLRDRSEPTPADEPPTGESVTPPNASTRLLDPDVEELLRRLADPRTPEADRRYMLDQIRLLASLPERADERRPDRDARRAADRSEGT
jgi:transcriptional regulator with XRE-family HTH domain